MFDYLYKFNSLDDSLKLAVSSPEAIYDIEALEDMTYDLSTLDTEIKEAGDLPDNDLYKRVLRTIRGATKDKAGEVDVKITIIGDDTASIKVSKGNRLLTERKVRFTQTSN